VGAYLGRLWNVFGPVLRNRDLRQVELAFVGFNAAEWAVWIAMLVYAYGQGGAVEAGIVAVVQLVPAALFAPLPAVVADRGAPARILLAGYVVQAVGMAATAISLHAHAHPAVSYGLATIAATAVTTTRPAQSVLVPGLARRPDELTAANVVSGWIESTSVLAAPAAAGVILELSGPAAVFAIMAGAAAVSALLVARLALQERARELPPGAAAASLPSEVQAGFRAVREEPRIRLLVGLLGAEAVALGALDVVFVVLALDLLHLGRGGAGYLNACFGAGGVAGVVVTATLVGRRRLVPPLAAGVIVWSGTFLVLGLQGSAAAAFVLLVVAGGGRTVMDVAGRTLLQRSVPGDLLSRVFGVLEALSMAALAVGSLATAALVAVGGGRAAVIGVGAVLLAFLLLSARHLSAIDASAVVPVVELALLRSMPIFASLPAPVLESLAASLVRLEVPAGTVVITEGEIGDRFYAIADGEVSVVKDGRPVAMLGRGDGFGEIALLRSIPRTATCVAQTPAALYTLSKEPFVAALTGHASAGADAAERQVRRRLAELDLV
jgi:Cyclic nucleotide-binding domain/Major Facilitator Superfamily